MLSILIADDDPAIRLVLETHLRRAGHFVRSVTDGVQALETLRRHHWDMLISDLDMPRLGGWELAATVRADRRWQRLRLLALTGRDSDHVLARFDDSGFDAWLIKPIRTDSVLTVIAEIMEQVNAAESDSRSSGERIG